MLHYPTHPTARLPLDVMPQNDMVTRTLALPREDLEAFQAHHPGHGAFSWFVREALKRYNELHTIDADDLIQAAVGEIRLD